MTLKNLGIHSYEQLCIKMTGEGHEPKVLPIASRTNCSTLNLSEYALGA